MHADQGWSPGPPGRPDAGQRLPLPPRPGSSRAQTADDFWTGRQHGPRPGGGRGRRRGSRSCSAAATGATRRRSRISWRRSPGAFDRWGLVTVVKHFPGHGSAPENSHTSAPVSAAARRVRNVHLPPFRAAIAAGAEGVMLGHFVVPAYDPLHPGLAVGGDHRGPAARRPRVPRAGGQRRPGDVCGGGPHGGRSALPSGPRLRRDGRGGAGRRLRPAHHPRVRFDTPVGDPAGHRGRGDRAAPSAESALIEAVDADPEHARASMACSREPNVS